MTRKQARAVALREILDVIGSANSELRGVAPLHRSNKYMSDLERKMIDRAWWNIEFGLLKRLERAERS